ncbi:hypothetical protein HDU98_008264 [Podochytrium sp. JEL0797]|nr:hypothetical protein HDU98_008264 [Podochytrium sp. JEL0797]
METDQNAMDPEDHEDPVTLEDQDPEIPHDNEPSDALAPDSNGDLNDPQPTHAENIESKTELDQANSHPIIVPVVLPDHEVTEPPVVAVDAAVASENHAMNAIAAEASAIEFDSNLGSLFKDIGDDDLHEQPDPAVTFQGRYL